jgi:hypothetical protein
MGILDWFRRTEKRSAMSGFTAEVMQMREAYISGRSGLAELTATAQSAISHWENGLALADVTGTDLLDRCIMGLIGRSLAVRGESVWLITPDDLIPCSDWNLRTRFGRPTAYQVSIPEAGGGITQTALAAEVLHFKIGADPAAPWYGTSPLRRAQLTAGLLNAVEDALRETFENAPIGSTIVPMPEQSEQDNTALGRSFRGQRGRVLLRESVTVSAAGGPAPATDWRPSDLGPDVQRTMAVETLVAAREAILMAFGILPALTYTRTTGPLVREAQRHLAQFWLQPAASLIAEEATEKLGSPVTIDCLTPLQAYDAGGRARAIATVVQALVEAKAGGVAAGDIAAALSSSIGIDQPGDA